MQFKLKSQFKPTGDQPQAISTLVSSVEAKNKHQTLLGVTGSGKTFTLANLIQETQRPTLIISHNKTLAGQLYQEFRDFFPENAVSYFVSYYDYYQPESYLPSTDTYIEKETEINQEIDRLRLSTTANLLSRPDIIVVASVSCIYNLGSPVEYKKNFLELISGEVVDRVSILNRLIDMQYTRSDYELLRGTFRLKGDTLQIWPANMESALHLELLEKTISSISYIDPVTGDKLPNQNTNDHRILIYPAKHYQTVEADMEKAFSQIKTDLANQLQHFKANNKIVEAYRLAQKVKHDLEMIQELGYVNGIENYSRYFDGRSPGDPPYTLLDYFHYNSQNVSNKSFLTIIDESHITVPQLRGMYAGDRSRKQTLIDYGFRLPSALDNRPLQFEEITKRLPQIIYSSATPNQWELELSRHNLAEQLIRPTGLIDPIIDVRPSKGQVKDLINEIFIRKAKKQRALVTTLTKRTAEALTEYLNDPQRLIKLLADSDIKYDPDDLPKVQYMHADVHTLDRSDILDSLRMGEYDVLVGINLLREGLDLPEVSLVAIIDADKEGFLRSTTSLIQTMGRAARHQEGRVILYADTVTKSMQRAMDEVKRRRTTQLEYNQSHSITPQTVVKPVRDQILKRDKKEEEYQPGNLKLSDTMSVADLNPDSLTPKDKQELAKKLTRAMNQAAKSWDFEKAAYLRDLIKTIRA
jgi:excinuclease ABC subunit B